MADVLIFILNLDNSTYIKYRYKIDKKSTQYDNAYSS